MVPICYSESWSMYVQRFMIFSRVSLNMSESGQLNEFQKDWGKSDWDFLFFSKVKFKKSQAEQLNLPYINPIYCQNLWFKMSQPYYQLLSQQNLMINSICPPQIESAQTKFSVCMSTPQKALEIQALNLNKISHLYSDSRKGVKAKPSTDRDYSLNETFRDLIEVGEQNYQAMELRNNNQKPDLLQKRKQYAEKVREKNRCSLKDQKSKNINSLQNHTLNLSLTFTPPKESITDNSRSQCKVKNIKSNDNKDHFQQIQKEYYSIKKFDNLEHSNSKVFAQTDMNTSNSINYTDTQNFHPQPNFKSSKIIKITPNTSLDLGISHREGNQSERKSVNNKENKPHSIQPGSARKNTSQKYTSYAEIFGKKSSMNTLIQSQKSKGSVNTVSRQLSSIKKDKSALKSMAAVEEQFTSQFSIYLDKVVNSLGFEGLLEETEGISRVNVCKNKEQNMLVVRNNHKQEQLQALKISKNHVKPCSTYEKQVQLKIVSRTVSEFIDFGHEYQTTRKQQQKELTILGKQNATFKRELASFRKENSTIRKELQNAKDYISELQLRTKTLLQQQSEFAARQEKFKHKFVNLEAGSELNCQVSRFCPTLTLQQSAHLPADSSLEQILISSEQQLFSLKSTNKALELRVYVLEKKLANEEELSKKRLAVEVHNWRDKYNKLRNENLKLKNSLHPFNSELSFSMDISREEL